MRALIGVNGAVEDYAAVEAMLRPDDYLIGADGGATHLLAMGRTPHVIVGDLDSLPVFVVDELRAAGVQIDQHAPEKDQTDLELAIERAIADGADEVILIGALGGRLDQTLANLLILAQRTWTAPVRVMAGEQIAEVLRGPATLTVRGMAGGVVSLIPLSESVGGITYEGLKYPLDNATLRLGSTRGVSNEFLADSARISIREGLALVIHAVGRDGDAAPA